ncbi:MAG: DUF1926 domain-containing protein, partial [Myxococcales bacterium]|nr:DUF1926 domain-containing protein [Myxococcales bacterium]
MSPRAVIVHLSEPLWAHARDIELWRRDVFQPVMDAVFASSGPIGLVLGGRLAERLASSDPDRAAALRSRVASGQVELVATALHAACLSSIPREDAKGQLRAHITVLRRAFGARPEGCWVPFQAWDPSLPRVLRKAGLSWATLDDAWLRRVGAPNAEALALEREGHAIIGLRGRPDGNGLVLLDPHDVESTAHALAALALPRDPIAMLLALPRARAYLPTGGPEGLWETRLLQDAGADALHKRMLRVSRLVRRLERTVEGSTYTDDGPDPMRLEQANRYLYRAQSGVAYGGASCSTAIRDRAWRDLIRAEAVAGGELALPVPACTTADLDCDGEDEVRLRTEAWSVTVAPASNGALVEIVRNREAVNVLSGMLPLAFRETWGSGTPVADRWELVTTEVPGEGLARVVLMADSALEGVPMRLTKGIE